MTLPSVLDRKGTIGASDAATCLRLPTAYLTLLALYRICAGLDEPEEDPPGEITPRKIGTLLEDPVCKLYSDATGRKIQRRTKAVHHKQHPFIRAHLDRVVVGQAGEKRIVEAKTADQGNWREWGEPGTDDVPSNYLAQVQHQMACSDADVADIPVLIGKRFAIYEVPRDQEIIDLIIDAEVRFMREHVEPGIPPEPETHADFAVAFAQHVEGKRVEATDQLVHDLRERRRILAEIKDLETTKKGIELDIKKHMGDAECLVLPNTDTVIATLKTIERAGYTVEPTSYRSLRVKAKELDDE